MSKIILAYWNIRGLAQPIRYIMEYAGLPWEDKLYVQAGANAPIPYDKSSWFNVKQTLDLRYANLPYLLDQSNGLKLTESQAIMRYVAKQRPDLNLLGANDVDAALCDEVVSFCSDAKGKMTGLQYSVGYSPEFFAEDLPAVLSSLESGLNSNDSGVWFVGSELTIADFVVWEYLDVAVLYSGKPNYLAENGYNKLAAFKDRFQSIPAIAGYLSSDRFRKDISGINNQHAKFR